MVVRFAQVDVSAVVVLLLGDVNSIFLSAIIIDSRIRKNTVNVTVERCRR